MKKLNIQKRAFSKSELKEINGNGLPICSQGLCIFPDTGEAVAGLVGKGGNCC